MVAIRKGQNNYIYIALTDKRLTSSNTYAFKFVNEVTNEEVSLSLTDSSSYKDRYSKFQVLTASFSTSTVGFWRYYVTQTGSASTVIATGKMELTADNLSNTEVVRYEGYVGSYKTYTV
jgi:hypothetical protein